VASVLAWIVGAVVAAGVGILALSLIGDGLTARTVQPLTPEVVAREASAAPVDPAPAPASPSSNPGDDDPPASAPPSGSASARATGQPAGTDKLLWSAGGSVIARCTGIHVYLVSWSPEPGYRAHDVVRGPAAQASVRFDGDDVRVSVSVRCGDGTPVATVTRRGDDGRGHE
jgi:hypothetical protein